MKNIRIILLKVILLLTLTYVLNNCSTPFNGAEIVTLKIYEHSKDWISRNLESYTNGKYSLYQNNLSWSDSITLINTSYDPVLVDYYEDEFPIPQGKIAITNRKDLYDLLKIANQFQEYKYIFIDIALDDKGLLYDDSLALLIPQMENIVVSRSEKNELIDALSSKAGWVDYYKMPYETNFSKYIYGTNERQSLALRAYQEGNNKNAITRKLGFLYFEGHKLCQKTSILDFNIRFLKKDVASTNSRQTIRNYQHLSNGFHDDSLAGNNNVNDVNKVRACFKDRIVVIGDLFESDIHDTYVGKMSGAIINLNAYINLMKGGHLVNPYKVILLFIFYFAIYLIKDKYNYIKNRVSILKLDFAQILIGIIGWGTFFMFVALFLYVFFDTYYNPWLPTLWFTFIPQCANLLNSLRSSKK